MAVLPASRVEVGVTAARGTVAVTGASGFVGRALVPSLVAAGYRVRALVREAPGASDTGVAHVAIGDLVQADAGRLRAALEGADALVHLAAQAHVPHVASAQADAALRALNAALPPRLARAASEAGVGHVVFASSVKVHGDMSPVGRPLREDDALAPADAYGASKVAAEAGLAQVARETGLRVTALRLPLVYGPGAKANFAALIGAVRAGRVLPVGAIDNRRSLLATGNLASALSLLLARADLAPSGELTPYLLADARPVSTPELVRGIGAALGVAPRIVAFPVTLLRLGTAVPGLGPRLARLLDSLEVDTTAFRTRYGWTAPVSFAAGLAAAVQEAAPL